MGKSVKIKASPGVMGVKAAENKPEEKKKEKVVPIDKNKAR